MIVDSTVVFISCAELVDDWFVGVVLALVGV
jgi:hypothetical protein